MSNFAAHLQSRLADKEPEIRQTSRQQDQRRRGEAMRFEQVRAEAGDLLARDLRPLVDDFLAVMQSPQRSDNQSLLRDGRIRVERPATGRQNADTLSLVLKALGPTRAPRYYELRVTATAAADGRQLALAAECVHYLPPGARRKSAEETLLALPALAFYAELASELGTTGPHPYAVCFWKADSSKGDDIPRAAALDYDAWKLAAREWLSDVLQKSAEAIMAASFSDAPATAPLCAPLVAVPLGAFVSGPVTV
jgi:hypothetical protein